MNIQEDFEELIEQLKQQRDEINLKIHLAGMEINDEWENAEKDWKELREKIIEITADAKETGDDFIHASKAVAEELSLTYDRIKERLKD